MLRKLFLLLAVGMVPLLALGSGKIHGKVTDASTGEALVGANVVVTGTSFGAVTGTTGEYVILNLPAGTYTLKASYIGYQAITVSNLRVNNELTTESDFKLPVEGVTVPTVEIVAERPMINKSATNAVRIIDNEFFDKIPARGLAAAIATQPGVVNQGGNIYIRGGRADEVGFRIEGVGANDILFGGRAVNVTAEAVEQVQVQAGGYNAEFGGANAGIVSSQLRTGSPDRWKASLLVESDRYSSFGKNSLGGWSYGYSDYTATFGGPTPGLGNKLRLFGAIENTFYRDNSVAPPGTGGTRAPYNFTLPTDPLLTPASPNDAVVDTLHIANSTGNAIGGGDNRWIGSGKAYLDLNPVVISVSGSYSHDVNRSNTFFANIFNMSRLPMNITNDGFLNVKISHFLTPTLFYEANLNYERNDFLTEDPQLGSNLVAYGDAAVNAKLGYILDTTGQVVVTGPAGVRSFYSFANFPSYRFFGGIAATNQPGTQIAGFEKRNQQSIGGRIDVTDQLKQHELKAGGEYSRYTIRRYAMGQGTAFGFYKQSQLANATASANGWSAAQRDSMMEYNILTTGGVDSYGYDVFGNEINGDVVRNGSQYYFGPRHPTFAAAYLQDKIELSDIIMQLGLRWDYIDPDSKNVTDIYNLSVNGQLFASSSVIATKTTSQISPRIGFSFPASDRTVFHVFYGKFVQQTQLRDSYLGAAAASQQVVGGFYTGLVSWGWGLKPTRTTQYEAGFSQQISDFASFDVNLFYKDIMDQVEVDYIQPTSQTGKSYYELVNADFQTSKGIELKLTLRRTNRLQSQVNYTFSDVRATGSNTASAAGIWSAGSTPDLPKYVNPVDFNYAHRGSILLDYRFAKNDGGPVLQQLGLNMLLSFNSGHNFTLLQADQPGPAPGDPRFRTPLEPVGSSTTPWFFQLDARLDKTFSLGNFDLNVYLYVINLLDTDNPTGAFFRTGDPSDDGYLSTSTGQSQTQQWGPQYVSLYRALNNGKNSGNYGPPRQIRFGFKLDY